MADQGSDISRRQFVKTAAGTAAAFTIVPRHVLGRGFQAPSDLVNIATVGVSGMGASNTRAVMSQNIVALCDVDFDLLDTRLEAWSRPPRPAQARPAGPPPPPHAVARLRAFESAGRGRCPLPGHRSGGDAAPLRRRADPARQEIP